MSGATEDGGPTTPHLMYIDLAIVSWEYCKEKHETLTENMICAGGEYNMDACQVNLINLG